MAEQLALCLGRRAEVDDILRWDQPMQSARSGGGTRDPQQLYDHLVLTENPYTDRQCILVDDVCTSGGHLQACAAKLIDHGAKVALAICAGQTVYDQAHEPFGHPDRTVPYFLPATQAVVDYSDADADPFNDYFWDLNLWGSRR